MARFLAESEIRHAVEQLGKSSARGRLCELLIGLRTLKLVGASQAPVAESVPEYVQAVQEFTLWTTDEDEDTPYFNPFDAKAAYKSKKFPSNGPSNTMHGWATQANSPFEIINTRPKEIRRRQQSTTQLRAFVVLGKRDEERPRLIDAAVWFYRTTDFDSDEWQNAVHQLQQLGMKTMREQLEVRFMEDLALSTDDANALFRHPDDDRPEDVKNDGEEAGDSHPVQYMSEQDVSRTETP